MTKEFSFYYTALYLKLQGTRVNLLLLSKKEERKKPTFSLIFPFRENLIMELNLDEKND